MYLILSEKWFERAFALFCLSVLPTCSGIGSETAKLCFGILNVLTLTLLIARLAWLLCNRKRAAAKIARENPRTVELRQRFYGIFSICWFVALSALSGPLNGRFWVVCGVAALMIAGYLVPLDKK